MRGSRRSSGAEPGLRLVATAESLVRVQHGSHGTLRLLPILR